MFYRRSHKWDKAFEVLNQTVEKFPNYIYGKFEMASYYLRRGEYHLALEALSKCKSLKELYPQRKLFHISEWIAFYTVLGRYFVGVQDIPQANFCKKLVEHFDPDADEIDLLAFEIRRAALW